MQQYPQRELVEDLVLHATQWDVSDMVTVKCLHAASIWRTYALKMEVICCSEISLCTYQAIHCHSSEHHYLKIWSKDVSCSHIFSHLWFVLTTILWKKFLLLSTPNNSEVHLTGKTSFDKTDISCLDQQYVYCYLPEDTTRTILFRGMVSIGYKKLFSIVRAVLKKSPL
jgi:hypothetical protein